MAHRLSTIIGADRIRFLEDGRLVEEGKYDELMAKDGLFAELVRRQTVQEKSNRLEAFLRPVFANENVIVCGIAERTPPRAEEGALGGLRP